MSHKSQINNEFNVMFKRSDGHHGFWKVSDCVNWPKIRDVYSEYVPTELLCCIKITQATLSNLGRKSIYKTTANLC